MKNLRPTLQVKTAILKRVVMLLDLFVLIIGIPSAFSVITQPTELSKLLLILAIGAYVISYELGWGIQHWIIRIELHNKEK